MGLVSQSYVYPNGYLTFPLDKRSSPRLSDEPPGNVSPLSGWVLPYPAGYAFPLPFGGRRSDRKSTRLNSSHVAISYAVFCLKKKKKKKTHPTLKKKKQKTKKN